MKVADNTVVTVSYIMTDDEDKVVGRSDAKNPVVALIGKHFLLPGLEQGLYGHEKGDEFVLKVAAKDAFGEYNPDMVQTIDRSMFGDFPVAAGYVFEADTVGGPRIVVVKEVTDDKVVVDANHPLAGKNINFFVTVDDVREATEEELAHGHAHPNGQCPSHADEGEHHCCCGHHHHDGEEGEEGHHCCGHHHHHDGEEGEEGEHHCCCGHHHHHDGEEGEEGHHGSGHHHHHDGEEGEEGEHHCGCGHHHHHDGEEGEDGENHCCCGHHHHHHHDGEEGEEGHHCGCGHHHHKDDGEDK